MGFLPASGGGSSSGPWTATIVKQADQSIASSVVLTNDTELFFTSAANGQYLFEALIVYGSPAGGGTPDIQTAFGEDATTRGSYVGTGVSTTDAAQHTNVGLSLSNFPNWGTAATNRTIYVQGVYWASGATFLFQWCQGTSGVNPTIVRAGSFIRYQRIV